MTPAAPAGLLTAEEFGRWVRKREADGRRHELFRGEVRELASWPAGFVPYYHHILSLLTDYVVRRGSGGVAMIGGGLIVGRDPDTVRCPTTMVFLSPAADEFTPQFTTEAPALVVDFSPPGDRGGWITRRLSDYLRRGAGLAWLIEPDERLVTVVRPGQPPDVFAGNDDLSAPDVLPGFACTVSDLFALPGLPPAA